MTESLADELRRFAEVELPAGSLYAALCRVVAADDALRGLLAHAPREQQRPNLLLAALHDLVLAGSPHPLRDCFPDVGGDRQASGAELAPVLRAFCRDHEAEIVGRVRHRTTQTNEVGRCAVLWPALHAIAERTGCPRIALLDLGCSAGLNLGADRYGYAYGDLVLGAPGAELVIACELVGPGRPREVPGLSIVDRLGIDPAPIDLANEAEVRWLRACVWPHDRTRGIRLERALAIARHERWAVRREADCTAAAADFVAAQPEGVLPVVFNSWVLAYFSPAALERHREAMAQLVRRGAAWLSAESPAVPIEVTPPAPHDRSKEHVEGTLWTLSTARGTEVLARSHPHGRWLQWFGSRA